MKRIIAALLAVFALCSSALAEESPYTFSGKVIRTYTSDSLDISMESFDWEDARCYLTKVWMLSPGEQIYKATANWEKDLSYPSDIAKKLDVTPILVVNGSGYVSPVFPEIPDNYPGTSADYYYTPLGSLTITNGEIFRNLTGVPFYGLTLQADGLHMHVGDDPEDVLAQSPTQTWSFYERCPLIQDGVSILDTDWTFANRKAIRTIIGKMDEHNYFLLTVTNKTNAGLTLVDCVDFLLKEIHPQWAYDLDGGPSSALLMRTNAAGSLKTIFGNNSRDADILAIGELQGE